MYTAAIIGTGRIGFTLGFDKKREQPASHTMALLANKKIRLIAAADTNQENLERWEKFVKGKFVREAKTFSTSEELYKAFTKIPDIITVAVNEDAHLKTALDAIAAKPRLLILEKPVALNMSDGLAIKRAAEAASVPVLVNHERRPRF